MKIKISKTLSAAIELSSKVDKLGLLLAQIADLEREAGSIKMDLKASSLLIVEGELFRATVSTSDRVTLSSDIVRSYLRPDQLERCEKISSVTIVRVVSR